MDSIPITDCYMQGLVWGGSLHKFVDSTYAGNPAGCLTFCSYHHESAACHLTDERYVYT